MAAVATQPPNLHQQQQQQQRTLISGMDSEERQSDVDALSSETPPSRRQAVEDDDYQGEFEDEAPEAEDENSEDEDEASRAVEAEQIAAQSADQAAELPAGRRRTSRKAPPRRAAQLDDSPPSSPSPSSKRRRLINGNVGRAVETKPLCFACCQLIGSEMAAARCPACPRLYHRACWPDSGRPCSECAALLDSEAAQLGCGEDGDSEELDRRLQRLSEALTAAVDSLVQDPASEQHFKLTGDQEDDDELGEDADGAMNGCGCPSSLTALRLKAARRGFATSAAFLADLRLMGHRRLQQVGGGGPVIEENRRLIGLVEEFLYAAGVAEDAKPQLQQQHQHQTQIPTLSVEVTAKWLESVKAEAVKAFALAVESYLAENRPQGSQARQQQPTTAQSLSSTATTDALEQARHLSQRLSQQRRQHAVEMARLQFLHQLQAFELEHNHRLAMCELRAAFDIEKQNVLMAACQAFENDSRRQLEEAKRKQWCAFCGKEAFFYCCWNTSYCDAKCQQRHWPQHMASCSQAHGGNAAAAAAAAAAAVAATSGGQAYHHQLISHR